MKGNYLEETENKDDIIIVKIVKFQGMRIETIQYKNVGINQNL